jgi:CrcB protein
VQWGPPDVVAAVALGGAAGAAARWAITTAWPHDPGTFPWSTFAVNVLGCLAIGVVLVVLTRSPGARTASPDPSSAPASWVASRPSPRTTPIA